MSDLAEEPDAPDSARAFALGVIRQALIDGEESGEPECFNFAAFKQRKAAQLESPA